MSYETFSFLKECLIQILWLSLIMIIMMLIDYSEDLQVFNWLGHNGGALKMSLEIFILGVTGYIVRNRHTMF